MRRSHVGRAMLLLCVIAALVAPGSIGTLRAQEEPHATPVPSPAPHKALVVPEAEKLRRNPVPNVPEALESGKNLFTSQCSMCHGVKADGRGDLARDLKLQIPDLTDPERQKKRTDGEWLYIISHGHRDMPAEKRLVEQQKWEMILYLRSLVKTAHAK